VILVMTKENTEEWRSIAITTVDSTAATAARMARHDSAEAVGSILARLGRERYLQKRIHGLL
jgi:hypothetical protein